MADPFLESGVPTIWTFSLVPSIPFEEKSIKPFGYDQGGEIDVTTMRNPIDGTTHKGVRTYASKVLARITNGTVTWAYRASAFSTANIRAVLGQNQLITQTFPNGATYAVYGYIDKIEPSEHSVDEGGQPTLEGTVVVTNRHSTTGVVTEPVYTAAP